MSRYSVLRAWFLLALIGTVWITVGEAEPNRCVSCHQEIDGKARLSRVHVDWAQSVHCQYQVTCEQCHGGDPQQRAKEAAHTGVYPSQDPRSTIHFQNAPETCGACHKNQLRAFKTSLHYRQLIRTGRGPNCITCHGSMATWIIQPAELSGTCVYCHNQRLQILPDIPPWAERTIRQMAMVDRMLEWTEALIKSGWLDRATAESAQGSLQQARLHIQQAKQAWHTFSLDRIETAVDKALHNLEQVKIEKE